jgi:CubicO group peptidase (beta-lactamase class C family)
MSPYLLACLALGLLTQASGASREADVDAYLRNQAALTGVPGMSVAVVSEGKVVFARGYGLANLELEVPATPSTVFELASVSKPFVATGVMLLVEEGKVALDDPVTKHLPFLPAAWSVIQVHHLLEHTSGLKDYLEAPKFSFRLDHSRRELIEPVTAAPFAFVAGEKWSYSNTNYLLLGWMIEDVSGQSLATFLRERVFRPLGMNATRVNDPRAIIPGRATGYEREAGEWKARDFVSPTLVATGDGAVVSSALDLAKWAQALEERRLLRPETRERMQTPARIKNGTNAGYGLGWGLGQRGGHAVVEHGGAFAGFRSHIARFPTDRLAVVVLGNASNFPAGRVAYGVAALFLPDLKAVEPPPRDAEPAVTERHRDIVAAWLEGKLDPNLFTTEAREALFPGPIEAVRKDLARLGPLSAFDRLSHEQEAGLEVHRYRLRLGETPLVTTFRIATDGKIAGVLVVPE